MPKRTVNEFGCDSFGQYDMQTLNGSFVSLLPLVAVVVAEEKEEEEEELLIFPLLMLFIFSLIFMFL